MIGRFFLSAVALVSIAGSALTLAETAAGAEFSDVAIFATNSIAIKSDVTVDGDVVVNLISPGPTLGPPNDFELSVDKKSDVFGDLTAFRIKVFQQATVAGDVFVDQLIDQGTINGNVLGFPGEPVFGAPPPFQPAVLSGGEQNVSVGSGQTVALNADEYGDITIDAGGTLNFTGGVYNIRSIDAVGDDATISFDGATELRIAGKFRTRKNAQIGPSAGASIEASDIVLYVGGINGSDGELGSTPEAARVGSGSVVDANFYAPNGTFRAETNVVATGAFLGRDVRIDSRATIILDSFFFNKEPTLDAIPDPAAILEDADVQSVSLTGISPGGAGCLTPPNVCETQNLTVTATSDNPGLIPDPTVNYSSPAATGTLSYAPVADLSGSAIITVTVRDDGGTANGGDDTFVRSFSVEVRPVNDAPSFLGGPDQTIVEDDEFQNIPGWATAISAGPPDEAGQSLTFSTTNDNNALFSTQPAVAPDGTLTYSAGPDANGVAVVTVELMDDGGTADGGVDQSGPQNFTIVVTPVPDAPRPVDDAASVDEGGTVTVLTSGSASVLANDVEVDGEALTVPPTGFGAANGTATVTADGTFSYTHDGSETTSDLFSYEACDPTGLCASASVLITVIPVNDAPEADPQAVLTNGAQPLDLTLTGTDPEGGPLTFTIDSGPGAGMLSAVTQFPPFEATVTYTPDGADDVEDSFTFKVTDPEGATDTAVVSINPIEDPPVPTGTLTATDDSVEVLEDTPLDIVLAAFLDVTNPDSFGDLSFAIVSGPDHGTLDPLTPLGTPVRSAATTYTPDAAFVGDDSFDFEVCGDLGSGIVCDTATVSIVVAAFVPPPPPVPPVAQNKTVTAVVDKPTVVDLSPGSVDDGTEPPGPRDKTVAEEINNGSAAAKAGGYEKATALTIDGGWVSFNNCDIGTPCPAGPFTFTIASGGACVSVTDAFVKSDQYTLTEGGAVLGVTSAPFPDDGSNQSDPDTAYTDPEFSSGTFVVGAGSRSIDVTRTASDLGGLAAAFIRVDSPGTSYCESFTNLTATAFSAPTQAGLGEVIGDQIQVTVTNTGTVDIAAGTSAAIGFYVSTDNMITTDDTLLTGGRENLSTSAPNGLPVGASISDFLFTGASIDTASPTGNVFIGVLVDEFDDLAESDENDNVASQAIVIDAVDLVVSSLTHDPASPTTEDQIEFTATVQNVGTATAGASELCFQIGGESCTAETLFDVPSLQAGATHVVTRFAGLPEGNYQNTAIADYNEAVDEANEGNNTTIDTYTVTLASELRVVATILTLPTNGTLLDINGLPISAGQTLSGTQLTFVPSSTGTAFFEYTLTDQSTGLTSVVAAVDVSIGSLVDLCAVVGRPPGCAPGG